MHDTSIIIHGGNCLMSVIDSASFLHGSGRFSQACIILAIFTRPVVVAYMLNTGVVPIITLLHRDSYRLLNDR